MISVCIPTYNGEKYIKEQLLSILKQINNQDEIIISDDSSTDLTIKVIKEIDDARIRIFENQHFHSPIFNLENALKNAKGNYIFLADQDDIWLEDKVCICLEYLQKYNCVVSDAYVIDKDKRIIYDSFYTLRNSRSGRIKNLYKNTYLGCCMAFDRKILELALPFPKNIPMHDIWIGLVANFFGKTIFIKDKLVLYRRHESNTSSTTERSNISLGKKILYRVNILNDILILMKKRH